MGAENIKIQSAQGKSNEQSIDQEKIQNRQQTREFFQKSLQVKLTDIEMGSVKYGTYLICSCML